jgi:large subunit ribosomal protein L25
MPPSRPSIEAKPRDQFGSRVTRRLRKTGQVPGVVYGAPDGSCISFSADARELRRVLVGAGALIDLKLDGEARPVIVKDTQRHPVRGEVMHIDLLQVRLDEKIQTQVAVHAEGGEDAPGVKEGGVISAPATTLNVEALPMEVPESIDADVSAMEMGDMLRLEDLPQLEGVTFLDDPHETVIATVTTPTREIEPEETEEEAAEAAEGAPEGEQAPESATEEPGDAGGDAAGSPGTVEG